MIDTFTCLQERKSKDINMKTKSKILKNYTFNIDNIERGINKRLKLVVSDYCLKDAEKQIKKMLGEIVAKKMTLDFSEKGLI